MSFWAQLENITAGHHAAKTKMETVIHDGINAARACLELAEQVTKDKAAAGPPMAGRFGSRLEE